jgi:hypothetical protein
MQRGHNFGAERAVVISRGVESTSSEPYVITATA